MPWIDGHLDLAYLAVSGRNLKAPFPDPQAGCVSLPALRSAAFDVVAATIFTAPASTGEHGAAAYRDGDAAAAEAVGLRQLDIYKRLESEGEISIVRKRADLDAGPARASPRAVLLMEGADPIRAPRDVERWHAGGLRMVGMAWAMGTRYAGGNHRSGPLTALGRELVAALDDFGIIHDASHLSDEALDGLLETASGPIVATHSNCRALTAEDQRHLRDDQIREIGRRGGIVGLNLFTRFLVRGRRARIADCVAHLERMTAIMGHRRGVGLGSDMDGGFTPAELPEGLEHPASLEALAEALRAAGWPDQDIDAFRHANWRRFLRQALPATA